MSVWYSVSICGSLNLNVMITENTDKHSQIDANHIRRNKVRSHLVKRSIAVPAFDLGPGSNGRGDMSHSERGNAVGFSEETSHFQLLRRSSSYEWIRSSPLIVIMPFPFNGASHSRMQVGPIMMCPHFRYVVLWSAVATLIIFPIWKSIN